MARKISHPVVELLPTSPLLVTFSFTTRKPPFFRPWGKTFKPEVSISKSPVSNLQSACLPAGHLPAAHKELLEVLVSEVAQHPLAPDHVVRLGQEVKVLQAGAEEPPNL